MIVETGLSLTLRCSRDNVEYTDDEGSGGITWPSKKAIEQVFAEAGAEVYGWRRFADRYLCPDCQVETAPGIWAEDPEPLPAADADKVARIQAIYLPYESVEQLQSGVTGLSSALDYAVASMRTVVIKGGTDPVGALKDLTHLLKETDGMTPEEAASALAGLDALDRSLTGWRRDQ